MRTANTSHQSLSNRPHSPSLINCLFCSIASPFCSYLLYLYQFAIIRAEFLDDPCASSTLGSAQYFVFMLLYAFVGFFSFAQLGRIIGSLPVRKFWLMTAEYSLIAAVCIFRALNHAVYFSLYKDLSVAAQTAISGIPYIFNNWSLN